MRTTLASNIVLTGGTAHLPGLQHRLMQELKHLVNSGRYTAQVQTWQFRLLQPPAKPNYVAWLGGKQWLVVIIYWASKFHWTVQHVLF